MDGVGSISFQNRRILLSPFLGFRANTGRRKKHGCRIAFARLHLACASVKLSFLGRIDCSSGSCGVSKPQERIQSCGPSNQVQTPRKWERPLDTRTQWARLCRKMNGEGNGHVVEMRWRCLLERAHDQPTRSVHQQQSGNASTLVHNLDLCTDPQSRLLRKLLSQHLKLTRTMDGIQQRLWFALSTVVWRCGLEEHPTQHSSRNSIRHAWSVHCAYQRPYHRRSRPRTTHVAATSTRSEHPCLGFGSYWCKMKPKSPLCF